MLMIEALCHFSNERLVLLVEISSMVCSLSLVGVVPQWRVRDCFFVSAVMIWVSQNWHVTHLAVSFPVSPAGLWPVKVTSTVLS